MKLFVSLVTLAFALGIAGRAPINDDRPTQVVETGKFRFYETKQIRGEETYEIRSTESGELLVQTKTAMPFAEQDTKPLVNVTFEQKPTSLPSILKRKVRPSSRSKKTRPL